MLYTIGSMMTPALGLILLPVYTNYLSPKEYGIMTTVQTLVGMFQLLLLLSLHGAVTRFYFDFLEDKDEQRKYLGSIFIFVLLFSTISCIILIFLSEQLAHLVFGNIPTNPYYFYLIGLSWLTSLISLPLALLRAKEKVITFVVVNFTKSILVISLTIYFIIVKGKGAESVLISDLFVSIIIAIVLWYLIKKDLKFSLNKKYIKESLIFSIPLLPHVASGWIISSSDRIILEKYVSLSEVGVYALAVQVSLVLSLFYASINNALVPRYTKLKVEGNDDSASKILKVFLILIISTGILGFTVLVYGLKFLTNESYHYSLKLLPFLIFAQILKGLYFIPVAKLFYYKKTNAIALSSTLAALINISINLFLIPIIGVRGAVISTIASEIIRTSIIYLVSRKKL